MRHKTASVSTAKPERVSLELTEEWYYAYPFSEEREPEHREQRVLATRSWHDPSKVTGRIRES